MDLIVISYDKKNQTNYKKKKNMNMEWNIKFPKPNLGCKDTTFTTCICAIKIFMLRSSVTLFSN